VTDKTEQKNKWVGHAIAAAALLMSFIAFTYNVLDPRGTAVQLATNEEAINGLDRRVKLLEGDMRDKD